MTETSATLDANTFIRTGYVFLGWATYSSSSYVGYGDEETVSISGNKDLYALWCAESSAVKITFKANGGTGDDKVQYLERGSYSSVKLRTNTFEREHYTFKGWAKTATSTTATYTDKQSVYSSSYSGFSSDTTLFAVWERSEYVVTYNANFVAEGATAAETKTQIVKKADAANAQLEANGFANGTDAFLGWSELKDAAEATYADGDTMSVSDDVTLYAVWLDAANAVQITLNANDESSSPATVSYYVKKGSEVTLLANSFARDGFMFRGWATLSGATKPDYADKASYSAGSEDATLYAVWKSNSVYIVTFMENNGSESAKSVEVPISKASGKITAEQIATATAGFAKSGYALYGWGTSASSAYAYYDAADDIYVSYDRTYYAIWKERLTITFNANGGADENNATTATQQVFKDASTKLNANPFTKSGYAFCGWSETQANANAENATRDYADGAFVSLSEATTLYAMWSNATQTVNFYKNDGGNLGTRQTVTASYDATKNAYVYTLPECTMTRNGYWFAGWAKSATVTSSYYLYESGSTQTKVQDWYAIWLPDFYTITYSLDGNPSNITQQVAVTADTVDAYGAVKATLSASEPTQAGYRFAGWSSTYYAAGEAPLSVVTGSALKTDGDSISVSADTTYYAVWVKSVNDCVLVKTAAGATTYALLEYQGSKAVLNLDAAEMDDLTISRIYASAFAGNTKLRRIYFPATVTVIDSNAFAGCTSLVKAFHNAKSTAVSISATGNAPLTSVLTYGVAYYSDEKYVTNSDATVFLGYFGNATSFSFNLDEGKTIAEYAFSGNDTLTSLTFTFNKDTTFVANTIDNCTALTTFELSNNSILGSDKAIFNDNAVNNCPALETFTYNNKSNVSYATSKAAAFANCPKLK